MLAATEERFGRLDGLVNNVGIGSPGKIEDIAEEDWDRVVEANLKSAMKCTRAAVPAMKRAGGGAILNISSIAGASGLISDAGAVVYATTKAGLHGFTLSVAADYAADGIRSNCLIVGSVDTPMVAHMGEAARQRRIDMVPLGKGTAWDVAWAAVFLASDEARWVTGVVLPVDAGLLATTPLAMLPHLK
jgi:NAD(P)-dependent dehydrogenase (short-subunit alcohol dehydrogenase family)